MIAFESPHFVVPDLERVFELARCLLVVVWAVGGLGGSAVLELVRWRSR